MTRIIPTINTPRLTLRGFSTQDFDRFAEIWGMPEVVRYIGGKPKSRAAAWTSFLCNAGQWQITGFGQWAIEDRASNTMIGQVGFFHGSRELGDDFDGCPEAGWVLTPEAQNQGLGLEAAIVAHDWFDRVIKGPLVCVLAAENVASMKVAQNLGYKPLRQIMLDGEMAQLMTRPRPPQNA
jgi:RimJ/RimL family protein N-acetyltransferase